MYSGTSGILAWFVCRGLFSALGLGFIRKTLVEQGSNEAFQDECLRHKRRLAVFCWVVDKIISNLGGAMMAGVPSRQLELGLHRMDNFQTIFKRILTTNMVLDNYFYYGYIAGEYSEACCPQYLKREQYMKLRTALNEGRLTLFEGTLVDVCKKFPDKQYTVASLLDHMDWMPPFMINEEMHWLQRQMCPKRGRCFWRSFSENVHSAPLCWLKPQRVEDSGDRVAMYWSTWMAKMDGQMQFDLRARNWATTKVTQQSMFGSLMTGVKIVTFPLIKGIMAKRVAAKHGISVHASKMEAFYESQKDEYDAFRENFLHARSVLADCIPLRDKKMVWVDVGGGTGRNLEFFTVETIKARFSKIYIVDVSVSLLEVAKKRIEAAGLSGIVECVFCDFTDTKMVSEKLPAERTCDLVTMSYSLSMIPNKELALQSAAKLLKPKGEGVLGLADFWYGGGPRPSRQKGDKDGITNIFTKVYCEATRLWFKQDGVILLKRSVLESAAHLFDFEAIPEEMFRKRVPLLPFLRPWHGVIMAPTK
jgi:betaine lipid synthase